MFRQIHVASVRIIIKIATGWEEKAIKADNIIIRK